LVLYALVAIRRDYNASFGAASRSISAVDAEIKAIIETAEGKRLQVSFGEETARIYVWQVVERIK